MCCGQKRSAMRSTPATAAKPSVRQEAPKIFQPPSAQQNPALPRTPALSVSLRYLERSPIRVRGPVTGQQYDFSGSHPVQTVDPRDAPALLRTRFFRQT
jgi:hypothetical protein